MTIVVRVQADDFDAGVELARLRVGAAVGAIVSFTGLVRDTNDVAGTSAQVGALTLEHYPGMTERSLTTICETATARWSLLDVVVIHRVGRLAPTDQIVFVAASSAHRGDAFAACDFVMDYLKRDAPFWKKEDIEGGARWVEARQADADAAQRWDSPPAAASGPDP